MQSSHKDGSDRVVPPIVTLTRTGAAFGLPLDTKTVEIELYLKLSGIAHATQYSAYPHSTITNSRLPHVQFGRSVASAQESIRYLASQHCDLNEHLSDAQRADAYAFHTLIDDHLPPALAYFLWIDSHNFSTVTTPDFALNAPFPVRFLLRYSEQREQRASLESLKILTGAEAVHRARLCLAALATKLGTTQYFFGHTQPTSVDVALAAAVAVLYAAPLKGGEFRDLLHSEFPGLLRHSHELVNRHLNYAVPFDLLRIKSANTKSAAPNVPLRPSYDDATATATAAATAVDSKSAPAFAFASAAAAVLTVKVPAAAKPHPVDWEVTKQSEHEIAEATIERSLTADEIDERAKRRRTKWMVVGMLAGVASIMLIAKWRKSVLAAESENDTNGAAAAAAAAAGAGLTAAASPAPIVVAPIGGSARARAV